MKVTKVAENFTFPCSEHTLQAGELHCSKLHEESNVLLFQGRNVVRPIDYSVRNLSFGKETDHPAQLRPVFEVIIQTILRAHLTQTRALKTTV